MASSRKQKQGRGGGGGSERTEETNDESDEKSRQTIEGVAVEKQAGGDGNAGRASSGFEHNDGSSSDKPLGGRSKGPASGDGDTASGHKRGGSGKGAKGGRRSIDSWGALLGSRRARRAWAGMTGKQEAGTEESGAQAAGGSPLAASMRRIGRRMFSGIVAAALVGAAGAGLWFFVLLPAMDAPEEAKEQQQDSQEVAEDRQSAADAFQTQFGSFQHDLEEWQESLLAEQKELADEQENLAALQAELAEWQEALDMRQARLEDRLEASEAVARMQQLAIDDAASARARISSSVEEARRESESADNARLEGLDERLRSAESQIAGIREATSNLSGTASVQAGAQASRALRLAGLEFALSLSRINDSGGDMIPWIERLEELASAGLEIGDLAPLRAAASSPPPARITLLRSAGSLIAHFGDDDALQSDGWWEDISGKFGDLVRVRRLVPEEAGQAVSQRGRFIEALAARDLGAAYAASRLMEPEDDDGGRDLAQWQMQVERRMEVDAAIADLVSAMAAGLASAFGDEAGRESN